MIPIQMHPHSQCVTFRTGPETFKQLEAEAKRTKQTISQVINTEIRNAFNILFVVTKEEKDRNEP